MSADRRPIVIGGCYRSGTSLLRRMINAHPAVHCGPEVTFFRDLFGAFRDDPLHHLRFSTTARSLADEATLVRILGGAFVELHEQAAAAAGKRRWADKNPDNVLYTAQWQELLGDEWLFVHVVRHPLDTLASMEAVGFPLTLPASLPERIELYRRFVEAGAQFQRDHPDRSSCVIYEELVRSPERVLSQVMSVLGEELDPRQLRFNDEPHEMGLEDPKVAATTEVGTDRIEAWRGVLGESDAALVDRELGELYRSCVAGSFGP